MIIINAAIRKKIKEIKRQKKQKLQRQYFIRRCVAIAIIIALFVIIIAGIKSCSKNDYSDAPVITVVPAQTIPPAVSSTSVDQNFYKDSCFIGNSVIENMEIYELIDEADYFAKVGLNVTDASEVAMNNSNIPVIEELNNEKQYKKIFMMFGENELSWTNIDRFKTAYSNLIKKAKQYQPSAQIYLLSVTPISKTADEGGTEEGVTKEAIENFNVYIKEIADSNNVIYADIYDVLANDEGYLPEDAATDGIHFDKSYYSKFLIYIQQNYNV